MGNFLGTGLTESHNFLPLAVALRLTSRNAPSTGHKEVLCASRRIVTRARANRTPISLDCLALAKLRTLASAGLSWDRARAGVAHHPNNGGTTMCAPLVGYSKADWPAPRPHRTMGPVGKCC